VAVDIPNYRIIEKLGEGAQSKLYRARCMRTGKDYTVKIVKVATPEDASFIDLLKSEHAIGSSLDHPTLRKVYELRIMRQRLRVRGAILFMEYVPGIAMSEKEFKRPTMDIIRFFIDVAEGLRAMHMQGYVHADLKPNNLIVTPDDEVKIIDLGQSSRIHEAKTRVQGTIDYIAPEQVSRGILDQRTDVFGLGATFYKVITGKAVATEMNRNLTVHSQSLIGKRLRDEDQDLLKDQPTCVVRFIEDCIRQDQVERIGDMSGVIDRLNMVQTILEKKKSGAEALAEHYDDDLAEPPARESDPLLEELGLNDPDDSVDLDHLP
jgi:serine/threonine-protein kinase